MSNPLPSEAQRRLRILYQYARALEHGDLEGVANLLRLAQQDEALDRMFQEIDLLYQIQEQMTVRPDELTTLQERLAHLYQQESETIQIQPNTARTRIPQISVVFPSQQERRQTPMNYPPPPFIPEEQEERGMSQAQPSSRRKRFTRLLQTLAAVLVLSILVSSFLLLARWPHAGSQTGGAPTSTSSTIPSWHTVPMPLVAGQGRLKALTAISPNDAWAVGENLIYHWNGQQWQLTRGQLLPNASLTLSGIAATSANDVWAVGSYQESNAPGKGIKPLLAHWDGQQWQTISKGDVPALGMMNAVATLAPNDVWVLGDVLSAQNDTSHPVILHWNGQQWSIVPHAERANTFNDELQAIAALSPNDIWAVGSDSYTHPSKYQANVNETLIEHWDGIAWKVVSSPSTGLNDGLTALTALSPDDIWAVGSTDQGMGNSGAPMNPKGQLMHWNGTSWSVVQPSQSFEPFTAIAALSAKNIWAVGALSDQHGKITPSLVHWDGQQWNQVSIPNSSTSALSLVASIPGTQKVWLAEVAPKETFIGPE